jgi:hypothetical protein
MTERLALSSLEIEILMDWLDKVRIGLWLGSIMYSKNPLGIVPHYGISSRSKKDRLLIISLTRESSLRLTFSGFNDPLFHYIPCFFGLFINGISLISLSADFLLNNEIPLPNCNRIAETRGGKIIFQLKLPNKSSISLPYVGKRFTIIAQINYPQKVDEKYFSKEQLQFMNSDMQSSRILLLKKKKIFNYTENLSSAWMSEEYSTRADLFREQNKKFLRLRNWIAIKTLKDSTNPFFKDLYTKLLNSNMVSKNY